MFLKRATRHGCNGTCERGGTPGMPPLALVGTTIPPRGSCGLRWRVCVAAQLALPALWSDAFSEVLGGGGVCTKFPRDSSRWWRCAFQVPSRHGRAVPLRDLSRPTGGLDLAESGTEFDREALPSAVPCGSLLHLRRWLSKDGCGCGSFSRAA